MAITLTQYQSNPDYQRVSEFLIRHYQPGNTDGNWLEPAWEYMHYHPGLYTASLNKIGIWEQDGEIVAVCHFESQPGESFFQFRSGYGYLREKMLNYAESKLSGTSPRDGRKYLCAYINETDLDFLSLVKERGYQEDPEIARPLYCLDIPDPFPAIQLPSGFRLTSLAEECDWAKVHQVLWRGFDHGDDVPVDEEELESRRKMFETPKARRDLKIAVSAPDGSFAAFCGMFFEPTNRYAYVEPVAVDPHYRRLGLGKAAVLEGIRRCSLLGATIAYVGSDLPFYQALGFRKGNISQCWVKYLE
ncbi:MAG: GNAT family N-acetyltransferase [Anaerolineales bacterium]|jgi:GNAT superfamily N-acetyltransferase|nr:GNAT family N-acetyltransferase [Anaerolineales bacterium]